MKLSQIGAVLFSLMLSLGIVIWLAKAVPRLESVEISSTDTDPASQKSGKQSANEPNEDGIYRDNPFELVKEGPQPKAVLSEELHDFGTMAIGRSGSHDFIITNEGDAPLKLAKGPVQCKCTLSELDGDELAPGESATITLEWTPKELGSFGQGARIWTNDPNNPIVDIRVEGAMVSEVKFEPTNGWMLGNIPSGRPVKLQGEISSSLHDSFEILEIETSSPKITLTTIPIEGSELLIREVKSGYLLLGEYQPDEDAGSFREQVTIRTSLENYPEHVFNISGNRSGPITIIGPGWTAGMRLLDLGRFSAADGKQSKLTFMVETFEEEFALNDVSITPAFLNVDLQPTESSGNSPRKRYSFTVDVPAGSPKGVWHRDEPAKLVLKTNHPKLEEIAIDIMMTIQ